MTYMIAEIVVLTSRIMAKVETMESQINFTHFSV